MVHTSFLKYVASANKALPLVKILSGALRMQHHFTVTALPGRIQQTRQYVVSQLQAAQLTLDRHASNFRNTIDRRQKPAGGHR